MPAFAQRLAAGYAFDGQPATSQRTVFPDGFGSILGTTWRKPAMITQKGAQHQLVSPDDPLYQLSH
jgi:hypothetical protein